MHIQAVVLYLFHKELLVVAKNYKKATTVSQVLFDFFFIINLSKLKDALLFQFYLSFNINQKLNTSIYINKGLNFIFPRVCFIDECSQLRVLLPFLLHHLEHGGPITLEYGGRLSERSTLRSKEAGVPGNCWPWHCCPLHFSRPPLYFFLSQPFQSLFIMI